jgi:hypothetical protein
MIDPQKIRESVRTVNAKRQLAEHPPLGLSNDGSPESVVTLLQYYSDRLIDSAEQAELGEMSPQAIIREFRGVAKGLGMIRIVKWDGPLRSPEETDAMEI